MKDKIKSFFRKQWKGSLYRVIWKDFNWFGRLTLVTPIWFISCIVLLVFMCSYPFVCIMEKILEVVDDYITPFFCKIFLKEESHGRFSNKQKFSQKNS